MNTSKILLFISFIMINNASFANNGTILIDWSSATDTCTDVIKNLLSITNMEGYSDSSIQLTHVCKTDGTLMEIGDCQMEIDNKIEIISYFFSLPENDENKQCFCQSKCINMHISSYTMKFLVDTKEKYFTTSNPCVAFCNKGYEIYLSAYALNSYPDMNGVDSIIKSFDSGCYNKLDNNIKRGRQLGLMKMELCKAHIVCNILINQYIKDIEAIEKALYGNVLEYDDILNSEQIYWIKPTDESSICIDLIDNHRRAFCINEYGQDLDFYCFQDNITVTDINFNSTTVSYAGSTLKLYRCLTYTENELILQGFNTLECICKHYGGAFMFSTDMFEDIYENLNERIYKYNEINFFFLNQPNKLDYPKESYTYGSCECISFEYIYDYMCVNPMYSSCIIDGPVATPKIFSSIEDKLDFVGKIFDNPVDMILGYGEEKCENLNTICNNPINQTRGCVYKTLTGFLYPILRVDTDFMRCVDEFFVNEGNESINYYYNCPEEEDCNDHTCSVQFFSKCKDLDTNDSIFNNFCNKYNFECAFDCPHNLETVCVEQHNNNRYIIATKYDICVRKCIFDSLNELCSLNEIDTCEVPVCKEILCEDCKNNDNLNCPSSCLCESNDDECKCINEICNDKESSEKQYCYFPKDPFLLSYKVTEKEKCIDLCLFSSGEADYISCENCENTSESCCEKYCENYDDEIYDNCVLIDQTTKQITSKKMCIYNCKNINFEKLSSEECLTNQCIKDCDFYNSTEYQHCYFDFELTKYCISKKELCILNCENTTAIAVDCTGINEYECFLLYCDKCLDDKINNKEIVCQDECICKDFKLNSIEECSCTIENCKENIDLDRMFCLSDGSKYALLNEFDLCKKNCRNEDISTKFSCSKCVNSDDCCYHTCSDSTIDLCVEFNQNYFYSNQNEICNKACENIYYNITDDFNCCINECSLNSDILCINENSNYVEYTRENYCNKLCIEKDNSISIVNDHYCCLDSCLSDEKTTYCIKINENYESITKTDYCNLKCDGNTSIDLYEDYNCCENSCYSEQALYPKGSYCTQSYKIFSSWVEYCINNKCDNNKTDDAIFCSSDTDCTVELCKEKICEKEEKMVISIKKNGRCDHYRNECIYELFKKKNEVSFKCELADKQKCIDSPYLFELYSSQYKKKSNRKFCMNDKLISSLEYDFYTKCASMPSSEFKNCNGRHCSQANCKQNYCKNKCKKTDTLYWGVNCKYYDSLCEVECLGLEYFDFFDENKLFSICKDHSLLNSTYLKLIKLKKTICLNTGELVNFDEIADQKLTVYTDCFRLKSKSISHCKVKCRKWIKSFK